MILLSTDLETTGLDRLQDRPIEVGAITYTTGQRRVLESSGYLVKSDGLPISARITELTGITAAALDKFGYEPHDALEAWLDLANQVDAIAGQNVKRFDKPFFENWCKRTGLVMPNKLWIDTRTDLPGVEGKTLSLMAAEAKDPVTGRACGFVNLNPHSALADCETVLKLIEMHDITKVVERAQNPEVVLIAHQKFENNQQAKDLKFGWNGDYKIWYRITKQMDVDVIAKAAQFDISFGGPEISIDKLMYA
jgi:DNA polymerase III epsilon subunit-like protein